jgi:arginase
VSRPLCILGAPSSAGAYAPGQEAAPQAFRRHGLAEALRRTGRQVIDRGDVAGFRWRPDPDDPKAMNRDAVRRVATDIAASIAKSLEAGETALVLGGDCTIELGTVAGAVAHRPEKCTRFSDKPMRQESEPSIGLVYVDLDVDLNIPETSDGALDWTGVAHLLDIQGSAPELAGLGPRRPLLAPEAILFFAADAITPVEARIIKERGLAVISLAAVKADPAAAARRALDWGHGFERLLVHLDADVLAYTDFPIAENVRRQPGLTLAELEAALAVLVSAPNWRTLTIAEVNPDHAPDEAAAFRRLIAMLDAILPR